MDELMRENRALAARCEALEKEAAAARRLRALVEHSPGVIAVVSADGRVASVTPSVERVLGWTPEAAVGQPLTFSVPPEVHARVFAELAGILARPGEPFHLDMPVRHLDGDVRLVELTGRNLIDDPDIGGIVVYLRDMTEQRRAEAAARDSAHLDRALFDESPACNLLFDVETRRILAANDAAVRQYGWAREELVGRMTVGDLGVPDDIAAPTAPPGPDAAPPRLGLMREQRRKDGSVFTAELQLHAIRVNDRDVCLVVAHDRTEHLRLEEQLRQAQKMEAIGRLAGGVAHDFNNHLTVILSYTTLALQSLPEGDPLRGDIEEVVRAGQRAADLTRQLLAFSRQQVLQPTLLDLNQILASMRKMVRRLLGEDIAVAEQLGAAGALIEADPGQIEQVVMNLLVNARDAMPRGGRLSLETALARVVEGGAPPVALAPGEYVTLTVSDTGVGMDAATRSRIFEPFFTTKERGKGTGLGLSTVFGIVQQSGGSVEVESAPGAGATFRVWFPRRDARIEDGRRAPRAGDGAAGGGRPSDETILLVEDADDVRMIMRSTLRRAGYFVLDAQNAGEAFLVSEQHAGHIDLLITDVVMPRMNGHELAARLRPLRPDMKVLYVSGYTEADVLQNIIAENAAFLQKPITPALLLGKLRAVLEAPPSARS